MKTTTPTPRAFRGLPVVLGLDAPYPDAHPHIPTLSNTPKEPRSEKINQILKQPCFAIRSLALSLVGFAFATGAHAETVSYDTDSGNTTLQGWNNRVWDGAALAWVDLAPDVTAMRGDINGGVILPTPGSNETSGLFAGVGQIIGSAATHHCAITG